MVNARPLDVQRSTYPSTPRPLDPSTSPLDTPRRDQRLGSPLDPSTSPLDPSTSQPLDNPSTYPSTPRRPGLKHTCKIMNCWRIFLLKSVFRPASRMNFLHIPHATQDCPHRSPCAHRTACGLNTRKSTVCRTVGLSDCRTAGV